MRLHEMVPHITLSLSGSILVFSGIILAYTVGLSLYRLYLHPLSKYPGPRLAALTYWYETYYTYSPWHKGKYPFKTHELHQKYGPILRITPDDISINDGDFYEVLYGLGKYTKDPWMYGTLGSTIDESMFTSMTNERHRMKREPLQAFFSRGSILRMESMVQGKVDRLMERLYEVSKNRRAINFHVALRAMAFEVVTMIAFDGTFGMFEMEDFGKFLLECQEAMLAGWYFNMQVLSHIPGAQRIVQWIPAWMQSDVMTGVGRWMEFGLQRLIAIKAAPAAEFEKRRGSKSAVFWHLLDPKTTLKYEPTVASLMNEAFSIIGAGGETSGSVLCQAVYAVLKNTEYHEKLVSELDEAFPDNKPMPYKELEALPYLTAVLKEALRIHCGAIDRLRRIVPADTGAFYKDAYFPPGTRISMCSYDLHRNPAYFPEPFKFLPERWFGDGSMAQERYYVPFGKGRRVCIGMNLALTELYLGLANLFRNFSMKLDNMRDSDMAVENGYAFFPIVTAKTQKQLSVFVTPRKFSHNERNMEGTFLAMKAT